MKKLIVISSFLVLLSCLGNPRKEKDTLEDNIAPSNEVESTKENTVSSDPTESTKDNAAPTNPKESNKYESVPSNPTINLHATVQDENKVVFVIETNFPLPIDLMASISLKNQKPNDTYIGSSMRITIKTSPYTYHLDISEDDLPSGEYEAAVKFYPLWGADNGNELAKNIKSEVESVYSLSLTTSHGTSENRMDQDKKQQWAIEHADIGTDWNSTTYVSALGSYQELTLKNTDRDPNVVKVYYFKEADMTIFVSKPRQTILMWKSGKTDTL